MGHEGKGSLLSLLKKKKLVTSIVSGVEKSSYASQFHVKITLTEQGLSKTNEIISDFFAYIRLLKSNDLPKHVFEEVKRIGEIEFVFKEHHEGGNVASYYASKVQKNRTLTLKVSLSSSGTIATKIIRSFLNLSAQRT